MNPDQFGKGGIKDAKDIRDFSYFKIAGAVVPFDWTVGFDIEKQLGITLPVKNQGASFSCGGQAWSTYGNVLTYIFDKKFNDRSARFIYSQTYQPGGGSTGRDNSDIVIKQGWAKESLVNSSVGYPPTEAFMEISGDISDGAKQDAALDKALNYAVVEPRGIDEVACAIRDNNGCVIGITGSNNGTWLSPFPQPPINNFNTWNHWVFAGKVKMINGKKYIGILNSWGMATGDNGWQWISEDYFNALQGGAIFSVWTILMNALFKHTFAIPLQFGMTNGEVVFLQKCLQSLGIFPKEQACTGYYGNLTRAAVFDFQKKYIGMTSALLNLGFNVGPKTMAALNKIFA